MTSRRDFLLLKRSRPHVELSGETLLMRLVDARLADRERDFVAALETQLAASSPVVLRDRGFVVGTPLQGVLEPVGASPGRGTGKRGDPSVG